MRCRCPECESEFNVPSGYESRLLRCKKCGKNFKLLENKDHNNYLSVFENLQQSVGKSESQVIPKYRRRFSLLSWQVIFLVLLAAAGLIFGWVKLGAVRATSNRNPEAINKSDNRESLLDAMLGDTLYKSAIRAYLSENLNDPDFEEVKWWPSVSLDNSLRYSFATDEFNMRLYDDCWKPSGLSGTCVRVKYRIKNLLGARVLCDQLFLIDENGTVTGRIAPENLRLSGESIDEYTERMHSEPSTRTVIAEANKQIEDQQRMRNFIRGIEQPNAGSNTRKPLKP